MTNLQIHVAYLHTERGGYMQDKWRYVGKVWVSRCPKKITGYLYECTSWVQDEMAHT